MGSFVYNCEKEITFEFVTTNLSLFNFWQFVMSQKKRIPTELSTKLNIVKKEEKLNKSVKH